MQLVECEDALQEVLAFIDACEAETTASRSSGDGNVSTGDSAEPKSASREKKRSQSERVKMELQQLRNDAEALETSLKRLKRSLGPAKSAQSRSNAHPQLGSTSLGRGPGAAMWMFIMLQEHQRRRKSENVNRRLRALLARQVSMIQASEAALTPKFSNADLALLVNLKTKSYHIDVEEGPLVTSLSLRARQLQNDVDNLLRRTGLVHIDSFFSWSQRKPDGSQFESTYCLSIPFSFELTRRAFDAQTPCTAEKNDMIKLKYGVDSFQFQSLEVKNERVTYNLESKSSLCVTTEKDRVIYVWTMFVTLASKQWTFVGDVIVVVRRANGTLLKSALQNWLRVRLEENGSLTASDPLKETIFSSLNNRVQDSMRTLKNSMETLKNTHS